MGWQPEREKMHRRAQAAEAANERAIFWIECIKKHGAEIGDGYLVAICKHALKALTRPTRRP